MRTIFISIASYRDPELVTTIRDCLERAHHPERLRFGIAWQHGPEESELPWVNDARFRIIDIDWRDSRGVCWARAEAMRLYDGEDFYLQLDSHHRFVDGWDVKAIDALDRTGSGKPLLTAYATPFDPGSEERSDTPMQMNFDRFTPEGIVLFRPGELRDWRTLSDPRRARFVSAHFLFAPGTFVADVPYDADLYFIGEEIMLTLRAFTHGYDLYHPSTVLVWHEYTREYRAHKHWTDHTSANGVPVEWHARDRASLEKVERFLAAPGIGPFGLGTARTFDDYEAYAGISVKHRKVQDYTRLGYEPPNPAAAAGWTEAVRSYTLELLVDKNRLPADVADYQFWYVGVHDETGRELFRCDADRQEVRGLLADDQPFARVVRSFDSDGAPATWTVWPVSDSRGWLERIDGIVSSADAPITR